MQQYIVLQCTQRWLWYRQWSDRTVCLHSLGRADYAWGNNALIRALWKVKWPIVTLSLITALWIWTVFTIIMKCMTLIWRRASSIQRQSVEFCSWNLWLDLCSHWLWFKTLPLLFTGTLKLRNMTKPLVTHTNRKWICLRNNSVNHSLNVF